MGEGEERAKREGLADLRARPPTPLESKSENLLRRYLEVALYGLLRRQRETRDKTKASGS